MKFLINSEKMAPLSQDKFKNQVKNSFILFDITNESTLKMKQINI